MTGTDLLAQLSAINAFTVAINAVGAIHSPASGFINALDRTAATGIGIVVTFTRRSDLMRYKKSLPCEVTTHEP